MSKLYTEEELRNFLNNVFVMESWIDVAINSLTPIELPSDQECIEEGLYGYASKFGEDCNPEGYTDKQIDKFHGFVDGAKWVRDKIKGGNNE